MKIYQVGGSIRDKLLGIPVVDRDWLVVGSTPEEMLALGYKQVGRDFPVFLHPQTHEEYALARTERKTAPGYRGFAFNTSPEVTLEQDLSRRDVTINAIAEDEAGNIIDFYNGRSDLEEGVLRHITPAFSEDPLRVLRVARFSARFNFRIAPETLDLMQVICESGELSILAAERIWKETEKALATSHPENFFRALRLCGALEVVYPEIHALFGVPQPENHHPEIDTGIHTMMVLQQAAALSSDTTVRFAALVHDLGKATTPKDMLPKHRGHEERGARILNKLCDRLKVPNRYRDLACIVCKYHLICHKADELRPDTIVEKLEAMDAFRKPERFEAFLLACEADARGRTGFENKSYPQADRFRTYFSLANSIDTSAVAGEGMSGKEIANTIHQLRINAIMDATGQANA
jgi:tRNA nucleotidyltransferase (CCA-adding enzyme)